jgi:hypothetical protein
MKMTAKKCFKILTMTALCVLTVMALRSRGAQSVVRLEADHAGYTCTLTRAIAGWDNSYIKLTNLEGSPRFALKWFRLPKEQEAEMMVTAIEAMRTGQADYVHADIHDGIFPHIQTMHLKPNTSTNPEGEENGFSRICQMVRAGSRAML